MSTYQVVVTDKAKSQIREYLRYIKDVLKNPQAAKAVRDDYKNTIRQLKQVAGSQNPATIRIWLKET